jgi:hypothetical protein
MHIKLPTLRDKLNPKPVTSPLRKKSKTIFGSSVNDSEKVEDQTCLDGIGGRGGEELDVTIT